MSQLQLQCTLSIVLQKIFFFWCFDDGDGECCRNLPWVFIWVEIYWWRPLHLHNITLHNIFILLKPFSEPSCPVWKHLHPLCFSTCLFLFFFPHLLWLYNTKHVVTQTAGMNNHSIKLWTKHVVSCSMHHIHEFRALCWRIWFAAMYCDTPIH